MNGAVPPNSELATLKLRANPLKRTRVGKISASRHGKVPSFIASIAPKRIWMARITSSGWPSSRRNNGTVNPRNNSEATTSMVLRPNWSDSRPIRKIKPI
ncbi:hypothetical protein D9M71_681540 [compost metagenome]